MIGSRASEKAATVKSKLGDEEYQANLKKNAAETWDKTATTLSSWWSAAATSVTNVLNEQQNGTQNVSLYNRDAVTSNPTESRPKKKMASLSSDQYFGQNEEDILGMNGNTKKSIDQIEAPFPGKKTKRKHQNEDVEAVTDDFDEWGFDGDGDGDGDEEPPPKHEQKQKSKSKQKLKAKPKDPMDSLLDFDANDSVKKEKDGNSSDELDAFFDQITNEPKPKKNGKIKADEPAVEPKDLLSNDQGKKANDSDDDWGWD